MERAQELAESISELMNCLAACAFPELGLEITEEMRAALHERVVWLLTFSDPLKQVMSAADLSPLVEALPTLEKLLARTPPSEADNAELRALAESLVKPIVDQEELRRHLSTSTRR